ncbi:juvenile hormone epoxide hydrolase-like [Aricia agestis]|uniref:juvenile hormone epoxide hydrolase-like n=1 Tax=Aricia agestis TaxID=91739 RepID=UPI001C2025FC|nr:juvenile hormone epoxide hydrolase-like [Aricia agestis]
MLKGLSIISAVVAVLVGYLIYHLHKVPDVPKLDYNRWWGEGPPQPDDKTITRFDIEFKDEMIKDLRTRLRNRRPFTRPMEGIQSQYGINTVYLDKILSYWHDKYDFKKRAALLNRYPGYKTRIQGLDIHYVHAKSSAKNLVPILLMHGWPSSSKEFDMVIPLLVEDRKQYDFGFEVIAVDLPGYGYSQETNKPGMNPLQIGIIMHNLMKRLGFKQYYIHAGDWGAQVGNHMITLFQDEILGFHTNMPMSSRSISALKYIVGSLFFPSLLVEEQFLNRFAPFEDIVRYLVRESGYFHIQATKPDTIGAALTDTPVGMAAYLLEKIGIVCNRDQTDTPHGGLESVHIDDLIDTLTIMWATGHITTATRLYSEALSWPEVFIVHEIPTYVPTAVINFRYEVFFQPDWVLRDKFHKLVRSTTVNYGGHFGALQNPKELTEDIFESVSLFRNLSKSD